MTDGTLAAASPGIASASARLGFGCSNLGSDLGYRKSCTLIETAFEAGFRHFDVAPSYGHGEAERIVGDVLRDVRSEVCLVTKAGIAHPSGAGKLKRAKLLLSPLKTLLPGLWVRGAGYARRATAPRAQFSASQVAASIQESLVRLRTTSIDWLLLHDVRPAELVAETMQALENARADGQVRGIGLGTSLDDSLAILSSHPERFGMVQANHFWAAYKPSLAASIPLVTHRAIRDGLEIVLAPGFCHWLGTDTASAPLREALSDAERSPDLLLAAAVVSGRAERVLVSSSRPERIRRFIALANAAASNKLGVQLHETFARYYAERVMVKGQSVQRV